VLSEEVGTVVEVEVVTVVLLVCVVVLV